MIPKALKDIEKPDLENLVAWEVAEGSDLDYKLKLPTDRRDFLVDVSSFANASGGDLVYGVREKRDDNSKNSGLPEAFLGLPRVNLDQEMLKLQSWIREGLEPALQVEMRAVPGFEQGSVLVVRVPQSWNSPHMIKASPSFYVRSNNGNNPLGTQEIRQAFLLSQTIEGRMRAFRDERLARILSDEGAVPLTEGPKAVFHILPFSSFAGHERFSVARLRELAGPQMRPFFEGLVLKLSPSSAGAVRYSAIFSNGAFEIAFASLSSADGSKTLFTHSYEGMESLKECQAAIAYLQKLGVTPPYIVSLALVGAGGYLPDVDLRTARYEGNPRPFPRDVLVAPETILEGFDSPLEILQNELFDSLWNATGYYERPR